MIEYFVLLTVETPMQQSTISRTVTVRPGATRAELYQWAREQLPEAVKGGVVLFFSAEPNRVEIGGGAL